MVSGRHKSRSSKKSQTRVASGTRTSYKRGMNGAARCQLTGQVLNGVPRDVRNKAKSEKRPSRPFGGALSPAAMKRVLIDRARN